MSALPASSQTVVAYLGYLLESGTISAKSLQPYLSAISVVHNDFEYPPPTSGHLVKLARKGFAELQGSSMLQPQQVTAFPAEHMVTIVHFGLRPNASKHDIRVCACLAAQFVFFSRADSGVLLTAINAQVSDSTVPSIRQSRMSHAIKVYPLRECPQLKTIPTTVSTNYSSAGNCSATIESQTFTVSLKTIRRHYPKTPASLPSGCSSSWWSSTFQLLQESNGPVILCSEVTPLLSTPSVCRLQ